MENNLFLHVSIGTWLNIFFYKKIKAYIREIFENIIINMLNKEKYVEVCTNSVESSLIAQNGGAYRVELCDNLTEGGTTPSHGQIEVIRKFLNIKLYVIIRPRGGDFMYSDIEFEIMKSDIEFCGKAKCDGVVIGMLNPDGSIDTKRSRELVDIAKKYSMGVTFHRAFDRSCDLFTALEDIINIGCERILTSGGKNTALEGADIIYKLIQKADNRIVIMPGAGITPENVQELKSKTGLIEVHGTFRSRYNGSMIYRNNNIGNPVEEFSIYKTDINKVREIVKIINN
jgi:copper homeostasis protein